MITFKIGEFHKRILSRIISIYISPWREADMDQSTLGTLEILTGMKSMGDLIKEFPRRYGTPEEIEFALEAIEVAVMDSYAANCPLKPKCQKKGDVWLNKNLDDQKKKVRTLKWKQRRNPSFRKENINSLTSVKNKVRKVRFSS